MQRENHRKAVSESDTASEGEGDCAMKKRWVYNVVIYTKRDGRKLENAKCRTYIGALLFIVKMSKKYSKEFAKARIDELEE